MSDPQEKPDYIRGAECQIVRAAANLWAWSALVEAKALPGKTTFFVYPRDMELGGPQQLNGKRVRVTFEIENE